MSHYSVKPIQATLQPSRVLMAALIGMHVLCLLLVALMPLEWSLRLGLVLVLLASLSVCWRREVSGRHVSGLHLAVDGVFSVCGGDGAWQKVEVLDSSFVSPWLTVLHLKLEGRRFMLPVLLLPDMLGHDDFRSLRVWLCWGRPSPELK